MGEWCLSHQQHPDDVGFGPLVDGHATVASGQNTAHQVPGKRTEGGEGERIIVGFQGFAFRVLCSGCRV